MEAKLIKRNFAKDMLSLHDYNFKTENVKIWRNFLDASQISSLLSSNIYLCLVSV